MLKTEDFQTSTWRRFAEVQNARLQELRELNDQNHDPIRTATIRGQIAAVKESLGLSQDSPSDEPHPAPRGDGVEPGNW